MRTGFLLVYLWNLCHASFHANELNLEADKTKRNSPTAVPRNSIFFVLGEKKSSSTFRQTAAGYKTLTGIM